MSTPTRAWHGHQNDHTVQRYPLTLRFKIGLAASALIALLPTFGPLLSVPSIFVIGGGPRLWIHRNLRHWVCIMLLVGCLEMLANCYSGLFLLDVPEGADRFSFEKSNGLVILLCIHSLAVIVAWILVYTAYREQRKVPPPRENRRSTEHQGENIRLADLSSANEQSDNRSRRSSSRAASRRVRTPVAVDRDEEEGAVSSSSEVDPPDTGSSLQFRSRRAERTICIGYEASVDPPKPLSQFWRIL
ncbi:hypothetical protein JCM5353_000482 [Sporobolomyces roseus]